MADGGTGLDIHRWLAETEGARRELEPLCFEPVEGADDELKFRMWPTLPEGANADSKAKASLRLREGRASVRLVPADCSELFIDSRGRCFPAVNGIIEYKAMNEKLVHVCMIFSKETAGRARQAALEYFQHDPAAQERIHGAFEQLLSDPDPPPMPSPPKRRRVAADRLAASRADARGKAPARGAAAGAAPPAPVLGPSTLSAQEARVEETGTPHQRPPASDGTHSVINLDDSDGEAPAAPAPPAAPALAASEGPFPQGRAASPAPPAAAPPAPAEDPFEFRSDGEVPLAAASRPARRPSPAPRQSILPRPRRPAPTPAPPPAPAAPAPAPAAAASSQQPRAEEKPYAEWIDEEPAPAASAAPALASAATAAAPDSAAPAAPDSAAPAAPAARPSLWPSPRQPPPHLPDGLFSDLDGLDLEQQAAPAEAVEGPPPDVDDGASVDVDSPPAGPPPGASARPRVGPSERREGEAEPRPRSAGRRRHRARGEGTRKARRERRAEDLDGDAGQQQLQAPAPAAAAAAPKPAAAARPEVVDLVSDSDEEGGRRPGHDAAAWAPARSVPPDSPEPLRDEEEGEQAAEAGGEPEADEAWRGFLNDEGEGAEAEAEARAEAPAAGPSQQPAPQRRPNKRRGEPPPKTLPRREARSEAVQRMSQQASQQPAPAPAERRPRPQPRATAPAADPEASSDEDAPAPAGQDEAEGRGREEGEEADESDDEVEADGEPHATARAAASAAAAEFEGEWSAWPDGREAARHARQEARGAARYYARLRFRLRDGREGAVRVGQLVALPGERALGERFEYGIVRQITKRRQPGSGGGRGGATCIKVQFFFSYAGVMHLRGDWPELLRARPAETAGRLQAEVRSFRQTVAGLGCPYDERALYVGLRADPNPIPARDILFGRTLQLQADPIRRLRPRQRRAGLQPWPEAEGCALHCAYSVDPARLAFESVLPAPLPQRAAGGGRPRFDDVFCGAGGLSMGFIDAGLAPALAVDCDENAVSTYSSVIPEVFRDTHGEELEGLTVCDKELAACLEAPQHWPAAEPLIVAGGLPCQPFSAASRGSKGHVASRGRAAREGGP